MNMKKLFNNEAGVSPIVATLVLVVVAIAGAAAVGTILGSFSGDVSDNANSNNAMGSASTEILVAGSSTVQPVSELIAKEFMANTPGVKVTVQAGGSGAGIASAGMGIVDIGAASKFMGDSDKTKFPNLVEHVIGGSAVVVIVNDAFLDAYPVENITQENLEYLYDDVSQTSIIIDGEALTSANKTVVYQRTEASGTEETFAKFATGNSDVDSAKANSDLTTLGTAIGNQGVLDAVKGSSTPAIGFVDFGFADGTDGVEILKIDGYSGKDSKAIKAAVKDLLAGKESSTSYEMELCRPLVYLTNGQPSSLVNNYIQFAMSPGSIDSFADTGYFGITELQ
jgi:phosphate transport system substrate-binding protein